MSRVHKDVKRDTTAMRAMWYEARDTYFGINGRRRDSDTGFKLALKCRHSVPDADWFCQTMQDIHDGKPEDTAESVLSAFREKGDARAIYFFGLFVSRLRMHSMLTSANGGYGPAQGWLALLNEPSVSADAKMIWANLAAAQDEPEGHYVLCGLSTFSSDPPNSERILLLGHRKRAAELGYGVAMRDYGTYEFPDVCPEKMYWLCMAARAGKWHYHLCDLIRMCVTSSCPDEFFERPVEIDCARKSTYQIGEVFRDCHDTGSMGCICGETIGWMNLDYIRTAVRLYVRWDDAARNAVVAWICVARRTGICLIAPDVRKVISRLIWETRSEALHCVSEKVHPK